MEGRRKMREFSLLFFHFLLCVGEEREVVVTRWKRYYLSTFFNQIFNRVGLMRPQFLKYYHLIYYSNKLN